MEGEKFQTKMYLQIYDEHYISRLNTAFKESQDRIRQALGSKETPESAVELLGKLETLIADLSRGKIVGDYLGNISSQTAIQEGRLKVEYKGYRNLKEALQDFREQLGLSQMMLSKLAKTGVRNVARFSSGNPIVLNSDKRTVNEYQEAKNRLMNIFDISPPEAKEELLRLVREVESFRE